MGIFFVIFLELIAYVVHFAVAVEILKAFDGFWDVPASVASR